MEATEGRRDKMVLRLGAAIDLDAVPSVPERYRQPVALLSGKLGSVFVLPETGEVWCRLNGGVTRQVWPPSLKRRDARTFPMNARQAPTPPPDAVELHPRMRVDCMDGPVGRLEGVVLGVGSGIAEALLLRVRTGMENDVTSPQDPLAPLVPVQGMALMVPPEWAKAAETINHAVGSIHALRLEATGAQVASGLHLRPDDALTQDVYAMMSKSPALAPFLSAMRVQVHDGAVRLSGPALSPRLRASLEQDIWHIPGVLAVRSDLGYI